MEKDNAIERTMLIPLWSRAEASRLYPEILVDRQAMDIVSRLDDDFSSIAAAFHAFGAMSHLVRAKGMDDAIRAYTAAHPRAAVVNIGAGLDTGFARVDNGTLRWFDLDLPQALAFRNSVIPARPRAAQLPCSVFDAAWFDAIHFDPAEGAIFTAAGVFYFFEEADIRALFSRMAEAFPGGALVFDANSSEALARSNAMMRQSGNAGAPMHFAVDDPSVFEAWSSHIRVTHAASRFQSTPRLPQMPPEMLESMQACDEKNWILEIHLAFV